MENETSEQDEQPPESFRRWFLGVLALAVVIVMFFCAGFILFQKLNTGYELAPKERLEQLIEKENMESDSMVPR